MPTKDERLKNLSLELLTRDTAVVVFESLLSIVITTFSIFGNIFVLVAPYRNSRLQKPSNLYIISLAVSDIVLSSVAMPLTCVSVIIGYWSLGNALCWMQASLATMLGPTSLQNMALIAADRFLKIIYPNRHRRLVSVRSILASIFVVWSTMAAIPLSFYFTGVQSVFHPGHAVCLFDFSTASDILLTLIAVFGALLPYQIIFICYFKVWRFIRRHNNQMNRTQVNAEEIKLTRLLVIIVGTFTICFTPFSVTILMESFFLEQFSLPRQVYFLGTVMVGTASCANPIIYGALNKEFKREFIAILRGTRNTRIEPLGNTNTFITGGNATTALR